MAYLIIIWSFECGTVVMVSYKKTVGGTMYLRERRLGCELLEVSINQLKFESLRGHSVCNKNKPEVLESVIWIELIIVIPY